MIQACFFLGFFFQPVLSDLKKIQRTLKGVIITQDLRLQGSDGDSVA